LLKWIIFGKVTEVLNYHGQIILPQNLNPTFRRVETKRNTWIYSVYQTYHYELLGQKGSIEQEIATKWPVWVQQPHSSDDIHETMKLRSQQVVRAECVMDIKAIHIHRSAELFSKEE
jgi:hypothetical protein